MNRTERLYAIAETLRARAPSPTSARRLAAEFEVSVRTIERDLGALLEAGVPLWSERGRNGGWVLDASASLPPLNLTTAEAIALSLALAASPSIPFHEAADSLRRKIVAGMGTSNATAASSATARIRVLAERGPQVAPAVLEVVEAAIVAPSVIEITYRDRSDVISTRLVEPLGLYGGNGRWQLIAWCRARGALRRFWLDRIEAAAVVANERPGEGHEWLPTDGLVPRLQELSPNT